MNDVPLILDYVDAASEQAWNAARLSDTVTGPELRFWAYHEPAVVLGRSQRSWALADETVARVERQAGGGAVLVGPWMLSASIVLPTTHPFARLPPAASYHWLGDAYATVLRDAGIGAQVLDIAGARELQQQADPNLKWACYGGFSPGEVVVGRRKLVGLAQVRRAGGVLFVAGLQFGRPDWALLCRALGRPLDEAELLTACNTCCVDEAGEHLSPLAMLGAVQRNVLELLEAPLERAVPWLPAFPA